MTILNYGAGLNSAPSGVQRSLATAGQMQGLQANQQNMNQNQTVFDQNQQALVDAKQQQVLQAQQKQAAMQEGSRLLQEGSPDEIADFMFKNEDIRKQFIETANFKDSSSLASRADYAKGVVSDQVDPIQAITQRIEEVEAAGGDAQGLKRTLATNDPAQIKLAAEKDLAMIGGDAFNNYRESMGIGQESKNMSADMNAFNELIKDMTPEQQKIAKQIKAGLKGRAITNAEMTAIEDGSIDSYSDYKTKQKEREKFAEATGASRARIIDKSFEKIGKINASIGNIDRAITAINEGAGTGVIEKHWPSIKAASVELENIRNSMALDVVGATTFGALSQGELDLAKDVALPTGLDGPELLTYLGKKRDAQNKLKTQYEELLQHLDQGGTEASFVRMKKRKDSQQPAQQPAQAQQAPQTVNWSDM